MANRYLLESGAPDGYLLEDGSGVLLLEEDDPSVTAISSGPLYPNVQYQALAFVPFFPAAPAVVKIDWLQDGPVTQLRRFVQHPLQAFVEDFEAAPEVVTLDKWYQPSPLISRDTKRQQPYFPASPFFVRDIPWYQPHPSVNRHRKVQHPSLAYVRTEDAPAPVAVDTWFTDSPAHYFRPVVQHLNYVLLDIQSDLPPIPPEPPEPPEPLPPLQKAMSVRVTHLRRPPGGFNTVYYVDDE